MNIVLIRESFAAIKPHALEVIDHFYSELFERYPQAKGLFKTVDMPKQQLALVNSLAHIVEFLDDGEHLTDYVRKLGKSHNQYGSEPVYFEWAAEALLATLAYYFEGQWTDELAASWSAAIGFIAKEMLVGTKAETKKVIEMKRHELHQVPTLNELAQKVAQELMKRAIDAEMASPAFQKAIRESAQELLRKATRFIGLTARLTARLTAYLTA